MFGIVIFYPAGQPIRNRSGTLKVESVFTGGQS